MYLLEKIERGDSRNNSQAYRNNNIINIDIYSDKIFLDWNHSVTKSTTYVTNLCWKIFVDLVESYTKSLSLDQEVIVYHNPLFPFVSMDKASSAFAFVKSNPNCILNAEFGITSKHSPTYRYGCIICLISIR